MRSVTYRTAAFAFIFTSLWFIIGLLLLWSPIPAALGIHSEMLVAWLLLFFLILAGSGVTLILASINGAFPPTGTPRRRATISTRAAAVARASMERGRSGAKTHQRS
jgi:hypothetical protein